MKQVRIHQFGGPEVLKLEEVPNLSVSEGQVLVQIKAIGINPYEAYIRAGQYGTHHAFPLVLGQDAAGIVLKVGAGVTRVKAGDRIYTAGSLSGCYAEQALCHEDQVCILPKNLSFEEGAGIYVPYQTAYWAIVNKARVIPGELVLVHGASGAVGIALIQLARLLKFKCIGTAGSEEGLKLIRQQGVLEAFNHQTASYIDQIWQWTEKKGVAVTFEMLANANLPKDFQISAMYGRIVIIGSRGPVEINGRDLMSRDLSLYGMSGFNIPTQEKSRIYEALHAGMELGVLRPVIRKTFPLSQAAAAHELILKPGAYGKIVLIP